MTASNNITANLKNVGTQTVMTSVDIIDSRMEIERLKIRIKELNKKIFESNKHEQVLATFDLDPSDAGQFIQQLTSGVGVLNNTPPSLQPPLETDSEDDLITWSQFDTKVAWIINQRGVDYALKEKKPSKAVDLALFSAGDHTTGTFLISSHILQEICHIEDVGKYICQIFHCLVKESVALCSSCYGSKRGSAPDQHARAPLPKDLLDILLGHAVQVCGNVPSSVVQGKVKRALNMAMQKLRLKRGLKATKSQQIKYNLKMKRGNQSAKKD